MNKFQALDGKRFGRLLVLNKSNYVPPTDRTKNRSHKWNCKCDCGTMVEFRGSDLKSGKTQSCGCLFKERVREANTTHGMSKTRIYQCWTDMIQRCENPSNTSYHYYGESGVKVCKEWHSFEMFLFDMKDSYNDNLTIDRIDSESDYKKSNCRWVTQAEQNKNQRPKGVES